MQTSDIRQLIASIESRIRAGRRKKCRTKPPLPVVVKKDEVASKQIFEPEGELVFEPVGQTADLLVCQFLPKDKSDAGDPECPVPARFSTSARPGTPEKIQVLQQRFEAGEELWHPADAYDMDKATRTSQRKLL